VSDAQRDGDALPTHAGQGGAIGPDALPGGGVQDGPSLEQNDASDEDRIAGIVAQTHSDVGGTGVERIADVLAQRFADAGLDVDADRTVALAAEIDAR
jgi:hypothetical protein